MYTKNIMEKLTPKLFLINTVLNNIKIKIDVKKK